MNEYAPHEFDPAEERRIYHEGIRLFNEGDFFEAHETWEDAWNGTHDRRREQFYRALIQSAVTLELLRRGRAVGVRQVFVSCRALFQGLPDLFMGLDIPAHLANVRHAIQPALDDLETRQARIDPGRLFRIELRYDPFADSGNGPEVRSIAAVIEENSHPAPPAASPDAVAARARGGIPRR